MKPFRVWLSVGNQFKRYASTHHYAVESFIIVLAVAKVKITHSLSHSSQNGRVNPFWGFRNEMRFLLRKTYILLVWPSSPTRNALIYIFSHLTISYVLYPFSLYSLSFSCVWKYVRVWVYKYRLRPENERRKILVSYRRVQARVACWRVTHTGVAASKVKAWRKLRVAISPHTSKAFLQHDSYILPGGSK